MAQSSDEGGHPLPSSDSEYPGTEGFKFSDTQICAMCSAQCGPINVLDTMHVVPLMMPDENAKPAESLHTPQEIELAINDYEVHFASWACSCSSTVKYSMKFSQMKHSRWSKWQDITKIKKEFRRNVRKLREKAGMEFLRRSPVAINETPITQFESQFGAEAARADAGGLSAAQGNSVAAGTAVSAGKDTVVMLAGVVGPSASTWCAGENPPKGTSSNGSSPPPNLLPVEVSSDMNVHKGPDSPRKRRKTDLSKSTHIKSRQSPHDLP